MINIFGEQFKTKAALTDKIRSILYSYEFDTSLNQSDFGFMSEVLDRHPSSDIKIGCGIDSMFVRQNPVYKNTRNFWIKRIDGSETDFSFLECLKPTTDLKKFKNACRSAVKNDIITFKILNLDTETTCPITGLNLTEKNSHVDHTPPNTFDSIITTFIETNLINPSQIKLTGTKDNEIGDNFSDPEIEKMFIEFHNSVAVLRLVSAQANLSEIKRQ